MPLLALGSGSAGGYLLILALAPVLTRLYSPADFGLFGVFGAVYAVLSIIVPLGYDQGIVGARRRTEALRISTVTHLAAAMLSVVALVLTIPAEMLMPADLDIGVAALALAVIVCWLTVFGQVATNFAIRSRKVGRAAAGTFANLAGRSLFQVGFGLWPGGLAGLVAGEFLGRLAGYAIVETGVAVKAFRRILRRPGRVLADARRNASFPLYLMPASALDVVLVWTPAPLFTFAYGPVAGGLVVIIQRLGSAPLTILNQSLGQLFHLEAARALDGGRHRIFRWLALIILGSLAAFVPLWLVLIRYGEALFALALGPDWAEAGIVMAIWAPLLYVQFVALLTNRLIIVLDRNRVRLVGSVINVALMFLAVFAALRAGMDHRAAMTLMIGLLTVSHVALVGYVLIAVARFRRP